ncbi:COG4223 family protein [Bradyrhizobium sp. ORS 111]|uniref:COG4223 family protein n=1 Tax=Bradyrhizobium sp. ORS 111 TaxID=1685958 RepID=UPI00388D67FF
MAEERPEDTAPSPDSARPKRAPPTIELEATEVSSAAPKAEQPEPSADAAAPEAAAEREQPRPETASEAPPSEPSRPVSPWVIAPVSGAVAAALVIAVGWLLGWPQVQPAPQLNAAAIDDLGARLAGLEAKVGRPPADPRLDALDKSIASLRSDLAATRAQSDKLAAAGTKAQPDLSAISARIDRIEGAVKAQTAEIAKQDSKIADTRAEAKPADDTPLRRLVAASLLDVAVRHGDPFVTSLAAAKALADDPDALKPLDAFAASGVPNANKLCRELIEIVPKLAPPPQDATTGAGLVDRLQAGASKLIHIERTDGTGTGTDRGSIVARMTSAAVHNDLARAEHELRSLPPADRTAAQAWIERVDARRAALDASRKFADNAMAALASVNQ